MEAVRTEPQFKLGNEKLIKVLPNASNRLLGLLRKQGREQNGALRVAVVGGGCSGLQYALGFDLEAQAGDAVGEQHGVNVVIDRFSLPYLEGAEVDFVDGLMGQGFAVSNPNAAASCGCGSSFTAEGAQAPAGAAGSCCGT